MPVGRTRQARGNGIDYRFDIGFGHAISCNQVDQAAQDGIRIGEVWGDGDDTRNKTGSGGR